MSFKFPFTCTMIDGAYSKIEEAVKDLAGDLLVDAAPYREEEYISSAKQDAWETVRDVIKDAFEEVRETNTSIRDAASFEITDKENEIHDISCDIDRLEEQIYDLKQTIEEKDNLIERLTKSLESVTHVE